MSIWTIHLKKDIDHQPVKVAAEALGAQFEDGYHLAVLNILICSATDDIADACKKINGVSGVHKSQTRHALR